MTYKPHYKVSEVVQMRQEGLTYRQIGEYFGISSTRIGQVIRAADNRAREAAIAATLRQKLKSSGDCSRKIPLEDMLCLLNLSGQGKALLHRWCNRKSIASLSLLDLMDMLLPVVEHPKVHYDLMPGYKVTGMGSVIYAGLIKSVSALDCGDNCEREWTARKQRLREYLRKQGGSFPYILGGRSPALTEA